MNRWQEEKWKSEVLEIVKKYAESINQAENTSLMEEIWLDSEEMSFVHPRGHEYGKDAIQKSFYQETMAENFVRRHLEPYNIKVEFFNDVAVVTFYWKFEAYFKDETKHNTEGRETQVIVKNDDNEWKIAHVHYSGMPVTGDREGF